MFVAYVKNDGCPRPACALKLKFYQMPRISGVSSMKNFSLAKARRVFLVNLDVRFVNIRCRVKDCYDQSLYAVC